MRVKRWISILVALVVGMVASMAIAPARAQAPTCNGKPVTTAGTVGTDGDDVIVGTEGQDFVDGRLGNDTICTLGGDDGVEGGPGDDYLDGGEGTDRAHYDDYDMTSVTVDLASGHATGGAGADTLVVGSVENVWLNCSTINADTLIGDDDANVLVGGSGDDHLVGNGGNDTLYGTDPSYGRTDAICWTSPDDDVLEGGDGDDYLLGQHGSNELDGGPGIDVLDGGAGSDLGNLCRNGERYARCGLEDPPEAPAACGDLDDNDGDGRTDSSDPDCASREDPTEETVDDPECFDGLDNGGDGNADFPEDLGCNGYDDETEYNCPLCPPQELRISYAQRTTTFRGLLAAFSRCSGDRSIRLFRVRSGRDRVVGSATTSRSGRWAVSLSRDPRGRFYAIALEVRRFYETGGASSDAVQCSRMRSRTIRP
jgi:Ca2+-binding RTX toxin-like protein